MGPRVPIVNLVLIGANIATAFGLLLRPEAFEALAFSPANPHVATAFTCLFVHANTLHLLGNMFFLAAVGPAVESAAGSVRFSVVYFLGGLVGVAAHTLAHRDDSAPALLVGASGAIAACVGYYAVRFGGLHVPLTPRHRVSVFWVVAVWVVLQAAGAFVHIGADSGTSYWSHLGGFASGVLLSLVFGVPRAVGAFVHIGADSGTSYWSHLGGFASGVLLSLVFGVPRTVAEEAKLAVLSRMHERSPGAVLASANVMLRNNPSDDEAWWLRVESLRNIGDWTSCGEELVGALSKGRSDPARILAKLIEIKALDRLDTFKRTIFAERLKNEHPDLARALLMSVLMEGADDAQRPDALLALASLDWEVRPEQAKVLVDELLSRYPLHPAANLAKVRGWAS